MTKMNVLYSVWIYETVIVLDGIAGTKDLENPEIIIGVFQSLILDFRKVGIDPVYKISTREDILSVWCNSSVRSV